MILNKKILQFNFYLLLIFPLTLVFSKFLSEIIIFLSIVSLFINFDFFKEKISEKWAIFFLLFYFWLCITTLQQLNLENFLKSTSYIRFLFFSLAIILILNTKKKFYFFLISIFVTIFFVQVDILIQFLNGKDLFGYQPSNEVRYSGPFGKELIAGGFLAKFFGISFFIFYLLMNIYNVKYKMIFSSLYLVSFLFIVFITGERMAFLLSLFMFFLIFVYEKRIRIKLLSFFIIFLILISTFVMSNEKYFNRYIKQNIAQIGLEYKGINYELKNSIYFRIWTTGYLYIKQKPIVGNGLKFYYINCNHTEKYFKNIKLANCIHPHNVYLDIVGATGFVGLILFILFIFNFLNSIKLKDIKKRDKFYELIHKGSFLSLIIILWPLKTSGAFFNNYNSMILFVILGLLLTNFKLYQKN